MKLIWTLTDFRAWWDSAARRRWRRAMRLRTAAGASRDLTNFGDVR
jgi:hypothetical protein